MPAVGPWGRTSRGSGLSPSEHAQGARLVHGRHQPGPEQAALASASLADHAVTLARVGADYLAGAGDLEALACGTVGLLFGHSSLLFKRSSPGGPFSARLGFTSRTILRAAVRTRLGRLRHHDHGQGPSLAPCRDLHGGDLGQVGDDAVDQPATKVLVGHLPAAEHDRELHLVPCLKELLSVVHLEAVVVILDLRTHLDFLEVRHVLLLLRLTRLAALFVLVLPVVHDAAHRRPRGGRHLDQIQAIGLRHRQSLAYQDDSDMRALVANHTNLRYANPLVDPGFGRAIYRNDRSLLKAGVDHLAPAPGKEKAGPGLRQG